MPEIEGHTNGSTVDVSHTEPVLQLTCISRLGRPAAVLQWFRNGDEVTTGLNYSLESIQGDKRENAKSKITIHPEYRDGKNNAVYMCRASNSAVEGTPLETMIVLTVQCK